MADDRHRVAGVIEYARVPDRDADHGILTTWIGFSGRSGGFSQGFGGMVFESDSHAIDYRSSVLWTFGVGEVEHLVGQQCFALYGFGDHDEPIAGLESVATGRRFVHSKWIWKWYPNTPSPLAAEINRRIDSVAQLRRQADAEEASIRTLKSRYHDWK